MRSLTLAAFVFLLPCSAGACRLNIPADALQGRIAKVALAIEHASTQAANLQTGWSLSIMNDPSWVTSVKGEAIVGAAFLSGLDFLSMLTFIPEPGFSCETLQQARSATVTLTFYEKDRLIRSRIDKRRVSFIP